MRRVVLGDLKNSRKIRKQLRSSYNSAKKIFKPVFGDDHKYDLVFSRIIYSYSSDGIDYYIRQNHTHFYLSEVKILRNLDLKNAIIRSVASDNLRKKQFKNDFLMDILAVGGGFYLSRLRGEVKISLKQKNDILEITNKDENYSFDRFMYGEEDFEVDFLGYFGAEIIENLVKFKNLLEISEKDVLGEVVKFVKNPL